MDLRLQIKMNPALYLRDPESSELGRKIISGGIAMIADLGFEDFTFKKLATQIGTTEASVYRYFENKHRLLTYIITWYWTWMEYQVVFHTNNLATAEQKIDTVIRLLIQSGNDDMLPGIDQAMLHNIAIAEGDKAFLTRHVTADNQAQMFKPYKDLCHRIALIFLEYRKGYPYPHSLASTLLETAHHQAYFKDHLPRLTDFGGQRDMKALMAYLHHLVFSALDGWSAAKKR